MSKSGLALEADYPYKAKDGLCSSTHAKPAASISGFKNIKPNDAGALMQAVATQGPIAISAAAKTWGFYFGGIFDGSLGAHCDVDIDHAVQLVGYGTDTIKGVQKHYWLVRNSWGAK